MIGRRIQHYQITEKLGEGGMGVVYKAEDTKLGRTVALKFLSPQVLDSPEEQQRLVNEARAAAGLHHPNICTIYEINEHEGQTFIAMAYVEGSTLRDRVLSGRIEVADALRYLIQIAEGLKQAHERDIVHRDIKSANIMVNQAGSVVIMDFGLAKRTGQIRGDERFSSGGTSAYMSPEQAIGEGVDQRTDIWSLGVVLYEMLAGQLPFRGDYEQAVIYSILNEPHRPVREIRPSVPTEVARIVDRCLEKNPEDRYQSLDALVAEVRGVLAGLPGESGGTAASSSRRSNRRRAVALVTAAVFTVAAAILVVDFLKGQFVESEVRVPIAVIDFNNQTGEASLDGLSGMLITALEQSRRLSVMTRTRMFDVLKTLGGEEVASINESVGQEICRAADVGALVIPSIRKFGNLYTIDLKVLDTRNNRYIFTTKEEGQGAESIPGMIDRIARGIRVDLNETSTDVESTTHVADLTTVNLDAYQQYFEGETYLNDLDFKKAYKSFKRAIELDSTFALAHYRLAYAEWWSRGDLKDARANVAFAMKHLDRIPDKEQFLVRALEAGLDKGFEAQTPIYREMSERYPTDKEMLFGLGDSEFHSSNYDSAAVHFERVLDLDPTFDRALQHLTWTYMRTDQMDRAEKMAQKWVDVTHTVEAYSNLATIQFLEEKSDAAMASLKKAQELNPKSYNVRQLQAALNVSAGRPDRAVAELKAMIDSDEPAHVKGYAVQSLAESVYPYMGRFQDAHDLLAHAGEQALSENGDTTSFLLTRLGEASLQYWAHEDTVGSLRIMDSTLSFPDRFKKEQYWRSLASLYFVVGGEDRAVQILAERIGPKSDIEKHVWGVLRHSMAGRCDSALVVMRSDSVLAHGPVEGANGVWFAVGLCLLDAGRYDDAIGPLRELVQRRQLQMNGLPYVAPAYLALGRAYEGKGDPKLAMENYRKGLDVWKDADPDIPMRLRAEARLKALTDAQSM
jgi:tetratricopeptide (TPR) repeat protein/TolB-like protein